MGSSTPIINKMIEYYHKTTLIKIKIEDAINFSEKNEIKGFNKDIF